MRIKKESEHLLRLLRVFDSGLCIFLRLHPLKSVNARVADVPWISLCRFRRIAGYVTESKSDRQGAAARRMVSSIKIIFLNII